MMFCRGGGLWGVVVGNFTRKFPHSKHRPKQSYKRSHWRKNRASVFYYTGPVFDFFCFSKKKFSTQSNGGKIFHAQKIVPLSHLNKIMVRSYSPICVDPLLPKCHSPLHIGTKMGPVHSPTNTFSQPHGNFTFGIF